MTNQDIEMQQQHENERCYKSMRAERLAQERAEAQADLRYSDLLENLSEPEGQGLIAEAIMEIGDTADMAKLIKDSHYACLGLVVERTVKDYLRKLAEREE